MSGGSTTWSSMLTRIMSSRFMSCPLLVRRLADPAPCDPVHGLRRVPPAHGGDLLEDLPVGLARHEDRTVGQVLDRLRHDFFAGRKLESFEDPRRRQGL